MSRAKPPYLKCIISKDKNMIYSYSSLDLFRSCPYKFHRTYIAKDYKEVSKAMDRGNEFHKQIASYIKSDAPVPPVVAKDGLFDVLKLVNKATNGAYPLVEYQMAVNAKGESVGYWDKTAVLRGAVDCIPVVKMPCTTIIDWKSGQMYDYSFQGMTYAALSFCVFPEVSEIRVIFDHLDKGRQEPHHLNRRDVTPVWDTLNEANAATEFPKKFNEKCKWCKMPGCEFAGKR